MSTPVPDASIRLWLFPRCKKCPPDTFYTSLRTGAALSNPSLRQKSGYPIGVSGFLLLVYTLDISFLKMFSCFNSFLFVIHYFQQLLFDQFPYVLYLFGSIIILVLFPNFIDKILYFSLFFYYFRLWLY